MPRRDRHDSAFTDHFDIGITDAFRYRRVELEKIAAVWGCEAGTPLDLDIIAYRIVLNMPLDGEWRGEAPEPGSFG